MRFETKALHTSQEQDKTTGDVINPIHISTTFYQDGVGGHKGFEYSRTLNPTRKVLEEVAASLENAKYGLAFASGCAASMAILSLLQRGENIVSASDIYGGMYRIFEKIIRPSGYDIKYVFSTRIEDFKRSIDENTKIIWLETPSNPLMQIYDIKAIAKLKKKNTLLVVDNTFATPYFQRPIDMGADIVIHSSSKYINGHSDVIGGLVMTNDSDLYRSIKFYQNAAGAVPSPFDCYLTIRGIKTLAIRMEKHQSNAKAIVNFLSSHKSINKIFYPGLETHPDFEIAKKQMFGFGGMLSFMIDATIEQINTFMRNLRFIKLAESLGGVESLICIPANMTHASLSREERDRRGITDNLIRLSVGIEDVNDLIEDLKSALNSMNKIMNYEI